MLMLDRPPDMHIDIMGGLFRPEISDKDPPHRVDRHALGISLDELHLTFGNAVLKRRNRLLARFQAYERGGSYPWLKEGAGLTAAEAALSSTIVEPLSVRVKREKEAKSVTEASALLFCC